jgi:uncharacterized protein involved in exopolysaccharide biosynthesis
MIKQLILLFLVFFLIAALLIAAVWTQIIPQYRAAAEVQVRPIIPHLVFKTEDNGMIPLYESFRNTQVSIVKSNIVLQRVLDQQEIQDTQWYKEPSKTLVQRLFRKPPVSHIERLRDDLTVKPRKETEIIDITLVDSSAEDAGIIVNTVLDQYIEYISQKSDANKDALYRKLVDQYKSLENEIQGRGRIIAELQKSLGTDTTQELISGKRNHLDDTQIRLNEIQQSIAILEWEQKKLEDLREQESTLERNDAPVESEVKMERKPKYHEDSEWRALDINVRTIQHNIDASELEPNNPELNRAKKDLEFAKELLQLREAQLDEQWYARQENTDIQEKTAIDSGPDYEEELKSLEHQLAKKKYEQKLLLPEFEKQQAEFHRLFEHAQLLEKEKNALQHKRQLFDAVRQRLDQKNIERNTPAPIEVLTRAFVPFQPYKDRRILYTVIVLILDIFGITFSGCLLHRHGFL